MVALVLIKIAVSLCVIGVGWLAASRLRGDNGAAALSAVVSALSRVVLDVSLPALAFTAIVKTTSPKERDEALLLPLFGFVLCALSALVGAVMAWLTARPPRRRTLLFVIAMPNWIYLPLPIAAALYGTAGTRTVLLCNVGALLFLWTIGVFILSGRASLGSALRQVAARPGLWATAAGIAAALGTPELLRHVVDSGPGRSPLLFLPTVLFQSLELLGTLTIPLALLCTGAQLAELREKARSGSRELAAALVGRLLLAPLLTFAVLHALPGLLAPPVRATVALIAAMPVAVSCSMFTRELGGDDELAATSILASTLASLATVPALLALWQQ